MRLRLAPPLIVLLLASVPTLGQRARRPAAEPATGPVTVTRSATLRIAIAGDTAGIFEYLSSPAKLIEWFPDQAIMEPQLGGKYHFRWKEREGVWSGVVTEFIRGNTLAYTWEQPGEAAETNVRFRVSPQGAETVVELVISGFTSSSAQEAAIKSWAFYLHNLKSVIEEGTDLRVQARRPAPKRTTRTRR